MKLLFIHSTKFKQDNEGRLYTGGSFNKKVWERYLYICEDVTVAARKESELYLTEVAKLKFNYFDNLKLKFNAIPNIDLSFSSINKVIKIIRELVIHNDIIIVRLPSVYGDIAIHYAKKYQKKYLVEVVGCTWDSLWNHSLTGKFLALPSYLLMKRSVKNSKYTIYVTNEFLQKRYHTLGQNTNCSNVVLDYNDHEILEYRIKKIKNNKNQERIILGTIGAVDVKYKGHEYVIQTLSRLKKMGFDNYEYQIVGGGDQTYLLSLAKKYKVEKNVTMIGSIPHKKVIEWLDNIDIYIQPSLTEGLPRSLIEAMSRGLPCIGSNVGGIPELLEADCVYRKNRSYSEDMCNLILGFNYNSMIIKAERNFLESQKYNAETIETRRRLFFDKFKSEIMKNK